MFLFGITTIIFILSTAYMVLIPQLIFQPSFLGIESIDPDFDSAWSLYKFDVVGVIISVTKSSIVCFPPSFIWPLVVDQQETRSYLAGPQRRGLCVASHGHMEV
jgi:hypothetical protein